MPSIATRKIAILAADGVDIAQVEAIGRALQGQGAKVAVLSSRLGELQGADGASLTVDYRIIAEPSVLWDAVVIPGGAHVPALARSGAAVLFVREQYKHAKPIAAIGEGVKLLDAAGIHPESDAAQLGILIGDAPEAVGKAFAAALAAGRFFNRADTDAVPA